MSSPTRPTHLQEDKNAPCHQCHCCVSVWINFTFSVFPVSWNGTIINDTSFPFPLMLHSCMNTCVSTSWVSLTTKVTPGYRGGEPDSPRSAIPGQTVLSPVRRHFASKGEINTAANLDSPISPAHSGSPFPSLTFIYGLVVRHCNTFVL